MSTLEIDPAYYYWIY